MIRECQPYFFFNLKENRCLEGSILIMDFIYFASVTHSIICPNFSWGGLYSYPFDTRAGNSDTLETIQNPLLLPKANAL